MVSEIVTVKSGHRSDGQPFVDTAFPAISPFTGELPAQRMVELPE